VILVARFGSRVCPNFFKRRKQCQTLVFERYAGHVSIAAAVFAKNPRNQRQSFRVSSTLAHRAVPRPDIARNEHFLYQSIDGHADGSGREPRPLGRSCSLERALYGGVVPGRGNQSRQFCQL